MDAIEKMREIVAYFDGLKGPDADCGESCAFISINDLRVILRAIDGGEHVSAVAI